MKLTQSIRWRLLVWIAFLLGLVLLALSFAACELHFTNRVSQLDEDLLRQVATAGTALMPDPRQEPRFGGPPLNQREGDRGQFPPPFEDFGGPSSNPMPVWNPDWRPGRPPGDTMPGEPDFRRRGPPRMPGLDASSISNLTTKLSADIASGFYVAIWTHGIATPFWQSSNAPPGLARLPLDNTYTGTSTRTRDGFREAYFATGFGDRLLIGRSLAPLLADTRHFAGWLTLGSLVALTFGVGVAWFIIASALRPVERISAAATKISTGDLSQRISVTETESELGQLAGVLNSAFGRLEIAFAQQKQFTADAAHELRTPLAVLISEAQTTLARERTASEYKEALVANLDTVQQMRRLTDSLLELARFDAGQENLNREKADLSILVAECVEFVAPLATPRKLRITCDLRSADIFVDTQRLALVVRNLLTNAIHYNRDGGTIHVATFTEEQTAVFKVADTGHGIAAEDLPHLFKRFYRADKSRSTTGLGLGLAITKAIVTAHGGTIEVSSQENIGAEFTVRLPISFTQNSAIE